jgi:hypothetical protein
MLSYLNSLALLVTIDAKPFVLRPHYGLLGLLNNKMQVGEMKE